MAERSLSNRRHFVVLHDLLMVAGAWLLAFLVRQDLHPSAMTWAPALKSLGPVVGIQAFVFWWIGLYRRVWRFAGLSDALNIVRAVVGGILAIAGFLFLWNRLEGIPRSILVLYPLFLTAFLCGPRLLFRTWKDRHGRPTKGTVAQRVLALGAGAAGGMLARELADQKDYAVVGFLDDAPALQGAKVHGLPVLGGLQELSTVVANDRIDLVVIAMPSASNTQMQRAVGLCEESGVSFRTLPRLQDLVSGKAQFTDLQEVAIEDLLGREPVQLDTQAIGQDLQGKTVFISGGGGSIGSELCRQVAWYQPAALVLLEVNEFNLYRIDRELRQSYPELTLYSTLADVRDRTILEQLFHNHQPEIVFHAAAYKHVPLLEHQAREAARNNLFGTRNMAEAADRYGTAKFVLISTDKAVNPTNVMGASKRSAEIFCQNLDARSATGFMTVRFGNVLASAGSVIPVFREQIAAGGPVTVTHPEVTRYFMTIPEACQLILQAETIGAGGEIFMLEMGKPVAIRYLAEQMIRLSGKVPGQEIEITYTGLRPGEKLHEELFYEAEALLPTAHQKILLAQHRLEDWNRLMDRLEELYTACARGEPRIAELLQTLVPEYRRGGDGREQSQAQDRRLTQAS